MGIWLKNVTQAWAAAIGPMASWDEVAIWQASGDRAWKLAQPGDVVLFRPEGRSRAVVGYGRYVGTTRDFAQNAHALFGVGLGVGSLDDLLKQIDLRRVRPSGPKPVIAIALFESTIMFPSTRPFDLPWPLDAADSMVALCSNRSTRGQTLLAALRDHARPNTAGLDEAALQPLVADEHHPARLRSRRLGWASLRTMTMRLYGHRCAVTGERVDVVQDVIHLRPRSKQGSDSIGNLIPCLTDLHRLVEHNLLAFDDDHRVMLSGQLDMFENSKYFGLEGKKLRSRLFGDPWPDRANLRWLREKFKGPRYRSRRG